MLAFGVTDTLHIGHVAGDIFIVQFTCGCVVGGGRLLLWPGRVAAVCEHVRSTPGQDFR